MDFLQDANSFVIAGLEPITQSAPHIYLSALSSIDSSSRVAEAFWPVFAHIPVFNPIGVGRHTTPLQVHNIGDMVRRNDVEGMEVGHVKCIAIFRDGVRVVCGMSSGKIQVIDLETGRRLIPTIQNHEGGNISAIAICW